MTTCWATLSKGTYALLENVGFGQSNQVLVDGQFPSMAVALNGGRILGHQPFHA